jgi:hypothetical protein
MSSNDVLQKVITSDPINSTAARVMRRGEHFEPKRGVFNTHFTERPPIRDPFKSELNHSPVWRDFRGHKFGRFTVIGIYAEKKSGGCSWVVRCLCGDYELRKVKAIVASGNKYDRCDKCYSLVRIKKSAYFRAHGRWPDDDYGW